MKITDRLHLLIPIGIFFIALTARLAYVYFTGIHVGGDTEFYQEHAQALLDSHFNPLVLIERQLPFYYWLYPIFIALFGNQEKLIVAAQILLQSVAAVLMYRIGSRIYTRITGILAGVAYAIFWELFQWDTYILTDSLFIFLLVFCTYLLTKKTLEKIWIRRIGVGIVILAVLFLRPTSLPFVAALIFYQVMQSHWPRKYWAIVIVTGIACALLGAYAIGLFRSDRGFGVTHYFTYFQSLFAHGIVLRDRPAYAVLVSWDSGITVHNSINILNIFVHKLAGFWYIYVKEFSAPHTLLNIVTFVPLYCLALLGWRYASEEGRSPPWYQLFIIAIVLYWFFQAATEVDYDWRYRLPIWPFLILLASYGATYIRIQDIFTPDKVRELLRYIVVGSIVAGADILVLNLLFILTPIGLYAATGIGFLTGSMLSFFLHSRFTFRYDTRRKNIRKFVQLLTVSCSGLLLTEAVMGIFVGRLGINYNAAKIVALAVSFVWAYSFSRWWVFRVGIVSDVNKLANPMEISTKKKKS